METKKENKDLWATPAHIVQYAARKMTKQPFDLDVAALPNNTKCAAFISPEQDCLKTEWQGRCCWLNPPYSNPLPFVEHAIAQSRKHGLKVVMLLNVDNSTRWFARIVQHAAVIVFLTEGRIAFLNAETEQATKGNNKPQMLVLFDTKLRRKRGLMTRYVSHSEISKIGEGR